MVRDNVTELIWENKTDDGSIHDKDNTYYYWDFPVFIATLNSLNFGGYSDWRIPTITELSGLVDSNIPNPGPLINTTYFPNTMMDWYWSSTPYESTIFIMVNFGNGSVNIAPGGMSYIRAVRGGQ